VLLVAQPLEAQAVLGLEAVNAYAGERVAVYDVRGVRLSGSLIGATSSEITLSVDRARRVIDAADVATVAVLGDSIWNGVLIGLGVGVLLTLLGDADTPSCDEPCFRRSALSRVLGVAMVGAIGGWLDTRRSRERVVYLKP
jgi:hypothetical protein